MKHQKLNTTKEISNRMSRVHLKNTKTEIMLSKALWHCGVRYRKNYKMLPGSPDIAILSKKIVIFVDGEFWHGYDWESRKKTLKHNREFWIEKIEENIARDKRNDDILTNEGWIVLHFWEKDVLKDLDECIKKVLLFYYL